MAAETRLNQLLRNIPSGRLIPMALTAVVIFIGCTLWTVPTLSPITPVAALALVGLTNMTAFGTLIVGSSRSRTLRSTASA